MLPVIFLRRFGLIRLHTSIWVRSLRSGLWGLP